MGSEISFNANLTIESPLGSGKFGKVFRARDQQGRLVALKIMWEGGIESLEQYLRKPGRLPSFSETFTIQFQTEVKILQQLNQYCEHLGVNAVPLLYEEGQNPSGLLYLAMEYIDPLEYPDMLRWLQDGLQANRSPAIPEAIALTLTVYFLQLCSQLHLSERFLLDAQLKNYSLYAKQNLEAVDETRLQFRILDWNGTQTFDEARQYFGFTNPASHDLHTGVGFLFEMLTGAPVSQRRMISSRELKSLAGAAWEHISPGTRSLIVSVLGREKGKFEIPLADIVSQVKARLNLWQGEWHRKDPNPRMPIQDLEDGAWFSEYFHNDDLRRAYQDIRSKLPSTRSGVFSEIIRALDSENYRAAQSADLKIPIESLDIDDLRHYHMIALLQQHFDSDTDRYYHLMQQALKQLQASFEADSPEMRKEALENVQELQTTHLFDKNPPAIQNFIRQLESELNIYALWRKPLESQGLKDASLYDLDRDLDILSPNQSEEDAQHINAQMEKLREAVQSWHADPDMQVYRAKALYNILNRQWNESLGERNPDPLVILDEIQGNFDKRMKAIAVTRSCFEAIQKQIRASQFSEARALVDQALTNFLRDRWFVSNLQAEINRLLDSEPGEEGLAFAAAYPLLNAEQRRMIETQSRKLEAERTQQVQHQENEQRRQKLPSELQQAATLGSVMALLKTGEDLGAPGFSLSSELKQSLHDLDQKASEYQANRPSRFPPNKGDEKAVLRTKLKTIQALLEMARKDLPPTAWLDAINYRVLTDLPQLDTRSWLRQFRVPLAVGSLLVIGIAAGAVIAINNSQQAQTNILGTATQSVIETSTSAVETATAFRLIEQQTREAENTQQAKQTETQSALNQALLNVGSTQTAQALLNQTPTITLTPTATATFTPTPTATSTYTPTATETLRPPDLTAFALQTIVALDNIETESAQVVLDVTNTAAANQTSVALARTATAFVTAAAQTASALETQNVALVQQTADAVTFRDLHCELRLKNAQNSNAIRVYQTPTTEITMIFFPKQEALAVTGRFYENGLNWWVVQVAEGSTVNGLNKNTPYYVLQDFDQLIFTGVNTTCQTYWLPTLTPTPSLTPASSLTPTPTPLPTSTPTASETLTPMPSPETPLVPTVSATEKHY